MKKGFTLIEMLGIITVLAILLIVTFPNLSKSLKQTKETKNNNFTNNLKISAETYIELNRDKYENLNIPGTEISFTIQDLYDANLLKNRYENVNNEDQIKVIVGTDGILRYFFNGSQIGIETQESDDNLSREIALIKENISSLTPDGIYYYNNQGNLEDNANFIYLTRNWNKPNGNILIHNHQFISGCIEFNGTNYDYYKGELTELTYPCSTIRGENLVVNGDLSYGDNTNFPGYTYVAEEGTNGYISQTSSTVKTPIMDQYVPVDIYNKSYEMGMTARSSNIETKYFIGFRPYDIDRNAISPTHIMYINNTLTTLSRDLNDGDEYIYITDLTNWNKTTTAAYQRAFIFWNYKDSTGYEYPELTYSRNVSNTDTYSNDNIDLEKNRIKLNDPWDNGYIKAGTKLSQRCSGVSFSYNIKSLSTLSTVWENLSSHASEIISTGSDQPYTKFWYGTKYIRLSWHNNYNYLQNATTDYKDIYIREVIE